MSDHVDPLDDPLGRLERALRDCRDALSGADESKRNEVYAKLRVLGLVVRDEATNDELEATLFIDVSPQMNLSPTNGTDVSTNSFGTTEQEILPPDFDPEDTSVSPETAFPETLPGQAMAQQLGNVPTPSTFSDYELLKEIARGGMGVVYKARQISLNRIVALKKVLSGQLARDEDIKRFQIEAEASASLDHPGIVPVYDFGQSAGEYYFTMGFVEGESLADRIRESPLEPRHAAEVLIKISRAVAYANDQGVIHRDLKPGNVLLDKAGEPRVTDFGLAKRQSVDSGMTATGQVLGTPSYMPPEQASGQADQVDQRADVYALGAILYATLAGRPPFQAANPMETIRQVLEQEPVELRQLIATMPRDLNTITLKALRKEPSRRYSTAGEFADDLQRWLSGEPILARRVSRAERVLKWCRRKPVLVASLATIIALSFVGSVTFWERQNATHVNGLVNSLVNAEAAQVPSLIDELPDYGWWSKPRLRQRRGNAPEGSSEELHLSLALLPYDPNHTETLLRHLSTATPAHVELIRAALSEHASRQAISRLWSSVTDSTASDRSRLNAACVLATVTRDPKRWVEIQADISRLLVHSLAQNPRDYNLLISMLDPLRTVLAEPLGQAYRDPALSTLQRETAFNILLEFAIDQPAVLCDVAMDADSVAFERIFALIEPHSAESVPVFASEANRSLQEVEPPLERERMGQRQANAAIALIRLGKPDSALPLLNRRVDPRSGAWFIHRVTDFGVPSERLTNELNFDATGDEAISIQMGLLQALGQYDEVELAAETREDLIPNLLAAYREHPDAGLHGSLAWLLRTWGHSESVRAADAELQVANGSAKGAPPEAKVIESNRTAASHHWYVNSEGQTLVVLEAGRFMMGSLPTEDPESFSDEIYHQRRIDRTFAISSTEVTLAQFRRFEQDARPMKKLSDLPGLAEYVRTEDSPITAVTWYDAAWYCNWLSEQEGIPEEQWCYEPNLDGEYREGMRIKEDFWELSGYRLPTEAEWEYACRAGSVTRRHYGHSDALLEHYATYEVNGGQHVWPVGFRLPNAYGLFDTLGNAGEWCLNEFDNEYWGALRIENDGLLIAMVDRRNWEAVTDSLVCVQRGGSFSNNAQIVRSAYRYGDQPSNRSSGDGFRIVKVHGSRP